MNTTTTSSSHTAPSRPAQPPGPARRWFGLPLLAEMKRDYLDFAARLQREHGDVTLMRILREQAYDIASPEAVRELLVDQADKLVRWERGIEVFEQLFGQSVLVTEGATWQRQRRMLQPAFTPRRVAAYGELMVQASTAVLDTALPAGQAEGLVEMDGLFTRLAMDVIMRTLFSSSAAEDAAQAAEAVQVMSAVALREMFFPMTLPDWLPLPGKAAKRRALKQLRGLVGRHIQARMQALRAGQPVPTEDLLAMLLSLRDADSGAALAEQEVFDQCMVSFQAGHETSATALLWWSRLMAEHPAALQQAREEVDRVLAGRTPAAGDLAALPWLGATLKEAMRLYPPIAAIMTRRATAELQVAGWTIPRGAMLRITPWLLHRDPRSFPEPQAFRPQRFMPDAPPVPRGAWMAFGTGPRVCIGQHFATLEMTLAAALLLQRYTLALPADAPPCEPVMQVTLRPRHPVRLLLARRPRGA